MKERPILMKAPMVRAILAGTKTQTRRVVKGWPLEWLESAHFTPDYVALPDNQACPYGFAGDVLWVRETWMDLRGTGVEHRNREGKIQRYAYGADTPPGSYGDEARKDYGLKWRPSIHMPRAASRITLDVTCARVERLQDISEADAIAEGIEQRGPGWAWYDDKGAFTKQPVTSYRSLWESINGPDSWDANPWVWVIEFRRIAP